MKDSKFSSMLHFTVPKKRIDLLDVNLIVISTFERFLSTLFHRFHSDRHTLIESGSRIDDFARRVSDGVKIL